MRTLTAVALQQMDVTAEFKIDEEDLKSLGESDEEEYSCTTSGGAAHRGKLGPFGLLLLADKGRREQTPVYFYVAKGTDGELKTSFCTDQTRSVLIPPVIMLIAHVGPSMTLITPCFPQVFSGR